MAEYAVHPVAQSSQAPSTGPSDPVLGSAERLCETLERIGDALAALDLDTLLETEETLSQLLAAIGRQPRTDNHAAIELLVNRGRAALLRCRSGAFASFARARLPLHTGVEMYGRGEDDLEPVQTAAAGRDGEAVEVLPS
jgi:hypothetical protein